MEPEFDQKAPETSPDAGLAQHEPLTAPPEEPEKPYRGLKWVFVGPQGLRAFWSTLIFIVLFAALGAGLGTVFAKLHLIAKGGMTPRNAFFGELFQVIALVMAGAVVALIERRSILDYNLRGQRRGVHFLSGVAVGFAALSALVGALAGGGWLHFGPVTLHGSAVVRYGLIWGAAFLLVGCFEEGSMRCFLLYTFTRGMNFWWASGTVACMCGLIMASSKGNGNWGVYIVGLLGLVPCLLLYLNRAQSAGFWNAAWATSTIFGALHTGNGGENWIGIFAAAFIGFVFCVSVWLTGSAWWAIGCHAAWDWAETYFYGTADSGFVAPGHLLTTSTSGNPLWSGGTAGPEGSLLIIPIVLLILIWLLLVYRRPRPAMAGTAVATESLAS